MNLKDILRKQLEEAQPPIPAAVNKKVPGKCAFCGKPTKPGAKYCSKDCETFDKGIPGK